MLKARDWRQHYHLCLRVDMVRAKVMAAKDKLAPPAAAGASQR